MIRYENMVISKVNSIELITRQYSTGERPVLVECDDFCTYVCKYPLSPAISYKLFSEMAGSIFAQVWGLNTPNIALVNIRKEHWPSAKSAPYPFAPSIGSRLITGVIDLTPNSTTIYNDATSILNNLLDIALFDFWIANEDRNANNMNLMYKPESSQIISIDYGCIFNTSMYDYPLSQLTFTDSILTSDLFDNLIGEKKGLNIITKQDFLNRVSKCHKEMDSIIDHTPLEWKIPYDVGRNKLSQLFESKWLNEVWENFLDCLNENNKS